MSKNTDLKNEIKEHGKDVLIGIPVIFTGVGLVALLFAKFGWKAFMIIVLLYVAGAACLGLGSYLRNELGVWKK